MKKALNLYKKASYLDPENLEIKKAEMRLRLECLLENNNVSRNNKFNKKYFKRRSRIIC